MGATDHCLRYDRKPVSRAVHMRFIPLLLVVLISPALGAAAYAASGAPQKKIVAGPTKKYRGTPGIGFLPGVTPPDAQGPYARRRGIKVEPGYPWWRPNATYPWYGWPGYYRGRWNGGGFGPCYTKTPIGPIWNCG